MSRQAHLLMPARVRFGLVRKRRSHYLGACEQQLLDAQLIAGLRRKVQRAHRAVVVGRELRQRPIVWAG